MVGWKKQALALDATETLSRRDIARMVEMPRSTVLDYLRANTKDEDSVNSRILWISDMHAPYHHRNTIPFLKHLKDKYNPTRVIIGGDEGDLHSLNMHSVDPDMASSGDELRQLRGFMQEVATLFPVVDVLESNHTSLAYRRAFKAGISKEYMKGYNDILQVPDEWVWHPDLILTLPNGQDCYFCHGKSSDGLKLSKNMSCNVVQGHYHSKFSISYWSNPNNLFWSMQAGCLVDDKSLAMVYNKLTLDRPIIGTGLIINSKPILEVMEC